MKSNSKNLEEQAKFGGKKTTVTKCRGEHEVSDEAENVEKNRKQ